MQQWSVFTDSGFPKRSWIHVVISVTESCWFSTVSLTWRDFSKFFVSFDDIMGCRCWNPKIPDNCMLSNTAGRFALTVFHEVLNVSPALLMKTFGGYRSHTQSWHYHLLPIKSLRLWKCSNQEISGVLQPSKLLLPLSQIVLKICLPQCPNKTTPPPHTHTRTKLRDKSDITN